MTTTMRRIGQQSVWTATFRDDTGALVDPATVTFKWQQVGETSATSFEHGTDPEVEHPSDGVYVFTAPWFQTSGRYVCWCESTVPYTSNEQTIEVSARVLVEGP